MSRHGHRKTPPAACCKGSPSSLPDPYIVSLLDLPDLFTALPRGSRLLGIDPGRRRIGLALSDASLRLAGPYATLARVKLRQNAAEIAAIARKEEAGGLVVGLPLEMDGTFGPAAQAARDWALALSEATGLPAAMQDERMTTAESEAAMLAADVSRARRAEMRDRLAAAAILQAALDRMG